MIHLIISREYPPASYSPGGIGTYVANIARLLVDRGEVVHIIGERWHGAPLAREMSHDGALTVHRIGADALPMAEEPGFERYAAELAGLRKTNFPAQWFSWHAAFLIERLVSELGVDVIEGQEWEAPLYYYLLRRSLGLGPRRHPPCIVHLHSPTEFTRLFNGHAATSRAYVTIKRMEAFCIHAADALLCPSRYLSRQASEHFGLAEGRIKVIPLPVGFTTELERSVGVWESGSICFVGRLEPRKGIAEWFATATRIAKEHASVHFDFIGADNFAMQAPLLRMLPREWLPRFTFHGSQPREELPRFLAKAMAGVVPSRWENFPNVCIEAMSSGLPVIATRLGGMVELVEDGSTGWLTPDTGVPGMVDGLAEALRRCLAAPGSERAAMGKAAAHSIRRICDNARIATEHISFRNAVAQLGVHSTYVSDAAVTDSAFEDCTVGIVVRVDHLSDAFRVGASIRAQTVRPRRVAVVCAVAPINDCDVDAIVAGATLVVSPTDYGPAAWNRGLEALSQETPQVVLFLDSDDELMPDCLERIAPVMRVRPDVGIISYWTQRCGGSEDVEVALCPERLYQLIDNEVQPASAFRTTALTRVAPFRPGLPRGYDTWEMANAILADGWSAVTFPAILARRNGTRLPIDWPTSTTLRAVRAEVLRPLASSTSQEAMELIDLFVPIPLAGTTSAVAPSVRQLLMHYVGRIVLHPVATIQAVHRTVERLRNGHAGWSA